MNILDKIVNAKKLRLDELKKTVSLDEIKQKDNVDRIFILGGEPLVHPKIDQIIDMIREQLYIKHVKINQK